MNKFLLATSIGLFINCLAWGQKRSSFIGVGPTIGIPVSNKNFSYYYKTGIGGTLQANFGMSKLGSITTKFVFLSIGAEQLPVTKISLTMIKAGYRTNFSDSKFFVEVDAGLSLYDSKNAASSSKFLIGGAVGYSFSVSKRSYIDLFPSYNQIFGTSSNSMWLTVTALYRFSLAKKK